MHAQLEDYAKFVDTKCKHPQVLIDTLTPRKAHLWHMITGIVGELGELYEVKWLKPDSDTVIIKELGDVLFYCIGALSPQGIDKEIKEVFFELGNSPIVKPSPSGTRGVQDSALNALEIIKKLVISERPVTEDVRSSLGYLITQVLVEVSNQANALGVSLTHVIASNKTKLDKRYGGKDAAFNPEAAGSHNSQ